MRTYYQDILSGASAELMPVGSRKFYISNLDTPQQERGKGAAKVLMQRLCDEADKEQMILELHAEPRDESTDRDRLVKFYTSFGFEEFNDLSHHQYDKKYIRHPTLNSKQRDISRLVTSPDVELAKTS